MGRRGLWHRSSYGGDVIQIGVARWRRNNINEQVNISSESASCGRVLVDVDGSAFLDKAVEFMISRMGPIFALMLAATLTIAAFKFDGFASGEVRADDYTIAVSALVTAILVLSEKSRKDIFSNSSFV